MNISILANLRKDPGGEILAAAKRAFEGKANITVFNESADKSAYINCDLVVVLGGDGTIIRAAKRAAPLNIPVCGVNLGKIGFLAAAEVGELENLAERIVSGKYKIEKRMMLEVSVDKRNIGYALNDVAIGRGAYSKMIKLTISVNDDFLDSYMADGTVVSTPTGSTAYSLSAGGPVAEPTMEMFLLTPICAYDLQSRSMVLPSDKVVGIKISGKQYATATLSLDGQRDVLITPENKVTIKKAGCSAQFVSLGHRSFYSVLRKKLGRKQEKI